MKTAELTGALLDYWVAQAQEVPASELSIINGACVRARTQRNGRTRMVHMDFSRQWGWAGPLIEKCRMYVEWDEDGYWVAHTSSGAITEGSNAQEAICRAVVRAKFGDEVPEVAQ